MCEVGDEEALLVGEEVGRRVGAGRVEPRFP
jgi:hypothetical protein